MGVSKPSTQLAASASHNLRSPPDATKKASRRSGQGPTVIFDGKDADLYPRPENFLPRAPGSVESPQPRRTLYTSDEYASEYRYRGGDNRVSQFSMANVMIDQLLEICGQRDNRMYAELNKLLGASAAHEQYMYRTISLLEHISTEQGASCLPDLNV